MRTFHCFPTTPKIWFMGGGGGGTQNYSNLYKNGGSYNADRVPSLNLEHANSLHKKLFRLVAS